MPEVATKPKANSNTGKPSRSLGVVVKKDKQQREFEQAVNDWARGKVSYETMWEKNPNVIRPTFKDFIIYLVLGRK